MADLKVFHVMRTLHIVMNHAFSSATERLYGVDFTLLLKQQCNITTKIKHLTFWAERWSEGHI